MAHLARSVATLRVVGSDLDLTEISALLGSEPSRSHAGIWLLTAAEREPEDIDDQVRELLGKLTHDIDVWRSLAEKYRVDLFCGLFLNGGNEGLTVAPATMAALSERSIKLGLDIYAHEHHV